MVAANKNLLKEVRRRAIKDELLAMTLRGAVGGANGAQGSGEQGVGERANGMGTHP
jgi:hypothetical protein